MECRSFRVCERTVSLKRRRGARGDVAGRTFRVCERTVSLKHLLGSLTG